MKKFVCLIAFSLFFCLGLSGCGDSSRAELPNHQDFEQTQDKDHGQNQDHNQDQSQEQDKPQEPSQGQDDERGKDETKEPSQEKDPEKENGEEHLHKFSEWETLSQATCKEEGEEERRCECGAVETRKVPIAEHSFSDLEIKKEASCTQKGEKVVKCSVCDLTKTVETAPLGHMLNKGGILEEATCDRRGRANFTCERCHITVKSETPALGHDFETEFTAERQPTCTEYGLEVRKCKRENCGEIAQERYIQPLNHDWELLETKEGPAPCGGKIKVYRCKRDGCGATWNETAQGKHQFGAYIMDSFATCTVGSWRTQICSVCQTSDTRYFSQNGHFWGSEYVVGIEPTEERDGYKYLVCTTCGAEKPDSRIAIPKYTLGEEREYLVTVCRTYNRQYYGEATIHVFDGDREIATKVTSSQNATFTLPAKDYTVRIDNLSNGYSPCEECVTLRPGKMETFLTVKASYLGGKLPQGYRYQVGDALYDLTFSSYDGKTYDVHELLKSYKAIFFNFYFTGCGYCNEEFPYLIEAQKKYRDEILVVYVNGHKEDKQTVEAHAKKMGFSDSIIAKYFLIDDFPGDKTSSGGWGYPTTVIVDCEGTIAERYRGALYGDFFETLMKKYVGYADQSGWTKSSANFESLVPETILPEVKRRLFL